MWQHFNVPSIILYSIICFADGTPELYKQHTKCICNVNKYQVNLIWTPNLDRPEQTFTSVNGRGTVVMAGNTSLKVLSHWRIFPSLHPLSFTPFGSRLPRPDGPEFSKVFCRLAWGQRNSCSAQRTEQNYVLVWCQFQCKSLKVLNCCYYSLRLRAVDMCVSCFWCLVSFGSNESALCCVGASDVRILWDCG